MPDPLVTTSSVQHVVRQLVVTAGIIGVVGPTTVAVDPPNQAGAGVFGVDVTVTGVAVGDLVFAVPPAALEANLRPVGAVVTAANTVRLTIQALAAIDGASLNWIFVVFDRT